MQQLLQTTHFACLKHSTQRRKNAAQSPYINHPIEVANLLSQCGITDVDVLSAALLHDTIEDTQTTADELSQTFGARVASIVQECTDDKSLSKVERKRLQIEHVQTATPEAKLVKLADKLSNLKSLLSDPPQGWSETQIWGYFVWAYHVVQGAQGVCPPLEQQLMDLFNSQRFKFNELSPEILQEHLNSYYKTCT